MWRRRTTPTGRVKKKTREKVKSCGEGRRMKKGRALRNLRIKFFLSNKVRIKGPATVTPPPFPIPAFILVFVLRKEEKNPSLFKKSSLKLSRKSAPCDVTKDINNALCSVTTHIKTSHDLRCWLRPLRLRWIFFCLLPNVEGATKHQF